MHKLHLEQKLTQRLSGQQIQFIKLLQVPTIELNDYISKEITTNPLLDEGKSLDNEEVNSLSDSLFNHDFYDYRLFNLSKKIYKTEGQSYRNICTPTIVSLQEKLKEQLYLLHLNKVEYIIGEHLIGSLDENGYLSCNLEVIVQDLRIMYYLEFSLQEVEKVLNIIQRLEPYGIAARNLQECLLIQLQKQNQKDPIIQLSQYVLKNLFDAFIKKKYHIIIKKLDISDTHILKNALIHIARLNPRPGRNINTDYTNNYLSSDFIIHKNQDNITVELVHYPIHKPRFNKKYLTMLATYEQKKKKNIAIQEIIAFLKKKVEHAKWFIEALSKRSQTLLKTMETILQLQYDFFLEDEETDKLKPMVLKNVADKVGMDASTISRIINQKSVQGKFGIYPLKFFFSEAISKSSGEDISNKVVKNKIVELIKNEDKKNPFSDDRIVSLLMIEGYHVARRTVTKYRKQLSLPVSRLRKILV